MKRFVVVLVTVLALVAWPAAAWAHAQLVSADPEKGVTLTAAPASVTLTFNERLSPDFTTIVVSDAGGQRVAASEATVQGASGTVALDGGVPGNGVYTVAYRVVSVDGHTVQGSYPFTVADPALPQASVAPAVVATPDEGGVPLGWLAGAGLLLALLTAVLVVTGRRRGLGWRSTPG